MKNQEIEGKIVDLQNYLVSLVKEEEYLREEINDIEKEKTEILEEIKELENKLI
jgi:chromosome segregation ATPase